MNHTRLSRLLPLFILLSTGPFICPLSAAHAQTSQTLALLVRDGAGNPLAGVALEIWVAGPPNEPFDNCVTDGEGFCRLQLLPGDTYVVAFTLGWRGRDFIPPQEQNTGSGDDSTGGGFSFYFIPSASEQVITFVVGQRDDGKLVPLWDLSRDANLPPQPFVPPQDANDPSSPALAGINLGALDTGLASAASQDSTTPTPQVVVSDYGSTPTPSPTPGATPTPNPQSLTPDLAPGDLLCGAVTLLALAGAGILVWLLARRRPRAPGRR